jgi:NitT/TauT family transport system substrate-binding protein
MVSRRSLVTAFVLTSALAGCAPNGGATPGATGPELVEITVGTLPIIDAAPIHLAIEQGFFADEGLSVTVELVQGGAAAIPALVGGDLDIAYGAWPSLLRATAEGLELRVVADGTRAVPGFTELLAMPASGLEGDPAAMAGKRIAVNTLGNIGELAVRAALVRAGLEPDAATLVEIPFPDMATTLERGDVDVIWASEPVATLARDDPGAVLVVDSYVEEMEAFPVAGYQATASFVDSDPGTIDAFRRAMARAVARIAEDESVARELAPGFTGLDAGLAERVVLPEFSATLEVADLDRVQQRMLDLGMLVEPLDLEALIYAGD